MKKHGTWLRRLAVLLILLLTVSVTAAARETTQSYFVLSAVADGRVIIAPERVTYTAGQTVKDALAASGHTFTGLEGGMVTAIDGVSAGFYRSGQKIEVDLESTASDATCYCFTTTEPATPSEKRQTLMTAMAGYLAEEVDVQNAAKAQYQAALAAYPDATDAGFSDYAKGLNNAIAAYKTQLNTVYSVTFTGHSGKSVQAVSEYGRVYDSNTGTLSLPAGNYTFSVTEGMYRVSGQITVSEALTVNASLPTGSWLDTDGEAFQVASAPDNPDSGTEFSQNLLNTVWDGSICAVQVPDTISGALYFYLDCNDDTSTKVTALYRDTDHAAVESDALGMQSHRSGLSKLLSQGADGNTVTLRLSRTGIDGYTQSMDYTVQLNRTPTLRGLTVKNQNGSVQAAEPAITPLTTEYTYYVNDETTAVTVAPVAFASDYTVQVNDTVYTGSPIEVALDGEETEISVTVSGGGYNTTYTLTIVKSNVCSVQLIADTGVDIQMFNANDEPLDCDMRVEAGKIYYQYKLVRDKTYYYVATKDSWYHRKQTVTANAGQMITVTVDTSDWLTDLALGTATTKKGTIALSDSFVAAQHSYGAQLSDQDNAVFIWAAADSGVTELQALYQTISTDSGTEKSRSVEVTSGSSTGARLTQLLATDNAYGNTVTLRLFKTSSTGNITDYQDYQIEISRLLSLDSMTAVCNGDTVPLCYGDRTGYAKDQTAYTVTVPAAATALELTVPVSGKTVRSGDPDNGYQVTVNDTDVTSAGKATVRLNGSMTGETVNVVVSNRYVPGNTTTITVTVQKAAPVYTTVELKPQTALLAVYEQSSGNRVWPEGDVYMLSDGFTYDYLLTASGYVGQSGTITVTKDEGGNAVLRVGKNTVETTSDSADRVTAKLTMTMVKAAENTGLKTDISSFWPSFRGNADNNGVVTVKTPTAADDSTLYWATKFGTGTGNNAVSSPILVEGDLVVYAGDTLYRVDRINGTVKASGTMAGSSSFAINPPVYANGMIFVGLSDGRIQAFDAATLSSLWVYQDPLKGQPNTNLTVHNGYLYAGFWYGEMANTNLVCLSITDEDPSRTDETKIASWRWTQKGGFYWAGAYVCDDYLLVGTDDGENGSTSQTSSLLMLDPKTGRLLDRLDGLNADIRSDICHSNGLFYFTSKGGSFYCVGVTQENSGWKLTKKWTVSLGGMSTSTPVVNNGRAYVGVSGASQFSSGACIAVIDLDGQCIVYTVATHGYPQTSGLLASGDDGYNYVYFMENAVPGVMRLLKDQKGQATAMMVTRVNDTDYAYALFTPYGEQAQYCISSPIADENGVLYFKNDSGHLMAFGPAVASLEVTAPPEKTTYVEGEVFDKTGMKITAVLKNGAKIDVTNYVTWSTDELTEADKTVTVSFPFVQYHNSANGNQMTSGQRTSTPTVDIAITVNSADTPATAMTGVHTEDGTVTVSFNGAIQDGWKVFVAYYDKAGKMISVSQAEFTSGAASATAKLADGAAQVKVFVLGEAHQPVMKNWTGTIES